MLYTRYRDSTFCLSWKFICISACILEDTDQMDKPDQPNTIKKTTYGKGKSLFRKDGEKLQINMPSPGQGTGRAKYYRTAGRRSDRSKMSVGWQRRRGGA